MRIAVVGGGITGLAAAWEAVADGDNEVVVHEAGDRFGGKILTTPFAGRPVDAGADAFLARVPEGRQLCAELGIAASLVAPTTGDAFVWSDGRLHPIPDGVLGVPLDGRARERPAPPLAPGDDPSIGVFVRGRLGDEVADRWVGPLVGGINAGDIDRLSLRAVTPQLAAAAEAGPTLLDALRSARADSAGATDATPLFEAPAAGMGAMIDVLVAALRDRGAALHLLSPIERIADLDADAVVIATPAPVAAGLLRPLAAEAADLLARIEYASVALVTIAVSPDALPGPLDGSGFLVPRSEGMLLTACSWTSVKWGYGPDPVIMRLSAGRHGDDRATAIDDDGLIERLLDDLARTMKLRDAPTDARVTRWPRSFPQYAPGHLELVDAVDHAVAIHAPNAVVAGAALRGLGVPACIRQGRQAVAHLLKLKR